MQNKHVGTLLIISVIMALFRTTVIIFNMETDLNDSYYLRNNHQTVTFAVGAVICIALLTVLAIYSGKGKRVVLKNESNLMFVSSCMLSFMIVGVAVIYGVSYFMNALANQSGLDIMCVVFAVISAFAIILSRLRSFSAEINSVLALAPLLWTVLRLINDFMKSNTSPLSASGAYHILSLVFLVLYFMCRGKAFLSKGSGALYLLFGYCAVFFLSVYALPNLVMHCLGFFVFDYEASLSAVDIVIAAYVVSGIASSNLIKAEE